MKEKIGLGVVGLGKRGQNLLRNTLKNFDWVDPVAVCDAYPDRAEAAVQPVKEARGFSPAVYTDHRELLADARVDAVLISAAWEAHVPVAVDAMRAGKAAAMEVGGAYDLEECWKLVRTWEQTRTPFMFLENCCFGKRELLATSLVRQGVLGEVVYCHGAYGHDLREGICGGLINRHYRQRNYLARCGDLYPTHDLGPIARLLNVNRGNRMLTLSSMASKARGLAAYAAGKEEYAFLRDVRVAQGDVVCTNILCADGALISLKLDTCLPRAYSRELTVSGTRGIFSEQYDAILVEGGFDHEKGMAAYRGSAADYEEKYLPKIWREMTPEQIAAGHGGMDVLTLGAFYGSLRDGGEMPIDVYDAAAWMAITCLSEASVTRGGAPVEIPDFTCGQWLLRPSRDVTEL